MSEIPDAALERWYKCERKVAILTESAAALSVWSPSRYYYACPFGDHWHIGRRQTSKRDRWLSHARRLRAQEPTS